MRRIKPSRILVADAAWSVEDATERRLELKVGFIRRIKVASNSHLVIFWDLLPSYFNSM